MAGRKGDGSRERDGKSTLGSRFSDLLVRVISAVVLVAVVVALLWWGEIPFTVGITAVVVGGLWELFSTYRRHGRYPFTFVSLAAGAAFPVVAYFLRDGSRDYAWFTLVLALYLPSLFALRLWRRDTSTSDVAVSLTGVILVGFCLAHFVLMLGLDPEIPWTAPFTVIVMVWIFDAVAYLSGSAFGKHKIVPRISPGKSWEGTIIGAAATFVAAYVLWLTVNRPEWLSISVAMELAALVCVFGFLGDLSESMVKRELGIKDMSSLIPGHGGIMDRFDSMFFTAAVSYYFLRFLVVK